MVKANVVRRDITDLAINCDHLIVSETIRVRDHCLWLFSRFIGQREQVRLVQESLEIIKFVEWNSEFFL